MAKIILTEETFDHDVLASTQPVLVDFWASWCGPCRMLAPIMDEIAEEYSDRVTVGSVNVDEEPALASRYAVEAIPTVILFRDGKAVQTSVGYCTKEQLLALL